MFSLLAVLDRRPRPGDHPFPVADDPSEWPSHFPPTGCPPADAVPTDGDLFRFLSGDRMRDRSYTEQGLALSAPPEERAALSCWTTLDVARNQLKILRGRFLDHAIGQATLAPKHGVMKAKRKTGGVNLWLRAKFYAVVHELFVAIS